MTHNSLTFAVLMCLFFAPTPTVAQEAIKRISAINSKPETELLLRSTTDIDVLLPVVEAFVADNPTISVIYEQWGSNALYRNSLAACRGQLPTSDAVFSSGVHQMIDLVNRACASPYQSDRTTALPRARRWRDELWGITKEPAVIIYNKSLVPQDDIPLTRFKLLDLMRRPNSIYQGKIATYDIEASGLGYLFAYMDSQEATTFGALLEGFARTDSVATCCSSEIIKGVAEGRYLIAYNVLGSYVDSISSSKIGIVLPQDYTLFLSRTYLIPKGAEHPAEAALLLEFMLSARGQSLLKQSNLVFEDHSDALPLAESAERAIAIGPSLLVASDQHRRARFITLWRSTFAR